jgi:L-fuculose-phosphate aldolase
VKVKNTFTSISENLMSTFKNRGIPDAVLEQFRIVGNDLFVHGLITSHGGNMSIRRDDRIIITRSGCMLGHIGERDLVETGLDPVNDSNKQASSEIAVHRAIYRHTPSLAVVHAHPAHAIALSIADDKIEPLDVEGSYYMPNVPIIGRGEKVYGGKMADDIARALIDNRAAVVYAHGSFAAGRDLYEALHYTSTLQESCRIIAIVRQLNHKKH